jgi:hypothetical protein
MSSMVQVQENVAAAERSRVGALSQEELALVARVRDTYRALIPIPCTDCQYCMPCPNDVDIPRNLHVYNESVMYGDPHELNWQYSSMPEAQRASACQDCGECEEKCPQQIPIQDWLKKVHLAAQ